jgi:CBS-domain-containing membrane protein
MTESLKVKKIDLRSYKLLGSEDYDVKGSLRTLLFHPKQELTVAESFENKDLADKIRDAGEYVLIDKDDYRRLLRAYHAMVSPAEDDLSFFARIRDAEDVTVKEVT